MKLLTPDANLSQSVAALLPLDGLSSVTGLLVKSCWASQGWAKPFGDHRQAGAKLLMEQHVKSGNEGLLTSGNGCSSHTGNSCSAAGLPGMEGIKASGPAKAKGQLKKSRESNSNTAMS